MAEVLGDNERRDLYRKMLNDAVTSESTRKYSFKDFEKKLLGDPELIGKVAGLSLKRGWAIDENDFAERFVPELKAPPAPKPKPVPAPAQQFPVGIAAPESIKGAAPSVTDIGREMAFKPAVQQPIEPVEPVEPIGVMAPEPIVEPAPSVTEVAREMAFKPPVEPKMPKEEEMSPLETAGQKVMEFASGFNRALFKAPSSVVKTASELGVGVLNMLGGDMQSEDAVLYSLADKYDKWLDTSEVARKWIGKPEYTGLATDVGSGLGQIASMVAAGPQGASQALLKTPTVLKAVSQQMFSKPSLIAFSQVFNSEFENMKAKGESEQTAFNQGLTNALATSPLENLPLINLAERLNKTIGVKLARRVLNALQQGAEEGGQEAVQQVFSNLTNNQLVESEQNIVDWAQGIQPSAEAGGVVGLLIGGLANAKAARGYSKASGLNKFSDNVVNNEIIQNAARDYQDNITKAEQQGKKPDSFNQKQLKKIAENPEAWVRDEIKYIQQTIESNKTLGLDSKVEENSLAKATSLLNQIKAEKKSMEQADIAPAQEAVPVAPEAEVIAPEGGAPMPQKVKILGKDVNMYNDYIPSRPEDVEPDAMYIFNADSRDGIPPLLQDVAYANKRESNGVKTENWHASISGEDLLNLYPQKAASPNLIAAPEATPVAEEVPFEEVPAETEDELAFLDEMRLTPEEDAARLAQEGIIPAAPVAPAEEEGLRPGERRIGGAIVKTGYAPALAVRPSQQTIEQQPLTPAPVEEKVVTEEAEKPAPTKLKVLGKDVNMYSDYIPSKSEDVEPDAMYVFNADSKDGIPPLLQDVAYANKKEVNGVKTEDWHASISGEDLLKLYPKKATKTAPAPALAAPVAQAEEVAPAAPAPKGRKKAAPVTPIALPKELLGKTIVSSTGFGGDREHTTGKVSLEDLKVLDVGIETARQTLETDKSFKPSREPIVVGVDVNTGEKQLLDGYHRYLLKSGKGEVPAKFIPMKNGEIISFEEAKAAPITPAPAAPKKEEGKKAEAKKEEGKKPAVETKAEVEFTSKQESSASQEFDGMKKPSKIKTKSFDGKHGKGAFERMKNITDNFEDIMDGMSGKIKQDCL